MTMTSKGTRRRLLKALALGSASASIGSAPGIWTKPVVQAVVLPAYVASFDLFRTYEPGTAGHSGITVSPA